MARNLLATVFVLATICVQLSLAVEYLVSVSYSDSACTQPNGAFIALPQETCTPVYKECFLSKGVYVRDECSLDDPRYLATSLAIDVQYPSNDCSGAEGKPFYVAWAGPPGVCGTYPGSYVFKFTECSGNTVNFYNYASKADCDADANPTLSASGTSGNCNVFSGTGSDTFFCPNTIPLPPQPPLATPVGGNVPVDSGSPQGTTPQANPNPGSPVGSNAPQGNVPSSNSPSSSTPSASPLKKTASSARTVVSAASFLAMGLMALF